LNLPQAVIKWCGMSASSILKPVLAYFWLTRGSQSIERLLVTNILRIFQAQEYMIFKLYFDLKTGGGRLAAPSGSEIKMEIRTSPAQSN